MATIKPASTDDVLNGLPFGKPPLDTSAFEAAIEDYVMTPATPFNEGAVMEIYEEILKALERIEEQVTGIGQHAKEVYRREMSLFCLKGGCTILAVAIFYLIQLASGRP